MGFVLKVVVNALALAVAAWLVDGIRLTSSTDEGQFVTLLVVGLIFGVVNAFVRPVVTLLSLPFIILTLGLMIFVINALMLMLTGWLAGVLGVAFVVDGFWSAVWGALIISIVTWGLEIVVGDATRERR
jgi:putative membrane protein